jgi:hypothetical protein
MQQAMQNRIAAAHRLGSSQLCLTAKPLQRGPGVRPRAAAADEAPTTATSGSSQQQVCGTATQAPVFCLPCSCGITESRIIPGCLAACSCLPAACSAIPRHTTTQVVTPSADELVKNLELARKSASKRLQRRRCVPAPSCLRDCSTHQAGNAAAAVAAAH